MSGCEFYCSGSSECFTSAEMRTSLRFNRDELLTAGQQLAGLVHEVKKEICFQDGLNNLKVLKGSLRINSCVCLLVLSCALFICVEFIINEAFYFSGEIIDDYFGNNFIVNHD